MLLRELLLGAIRDGAAALVSSHHLDEVARIADRAFFEMVHAADRAHRSAMGTTSKDPAR